MRLLVPQERLGPHSFLACMLVIGILSLMPVDLYVPALPSMQDELQVSASALNLTMFAFFFSSAFAVVLAGPVSDRFGRRPLLIFTCLLLTVSSVVCVLASSIAVLVMGRIGQAFSYGFEMTLQTAMISDAYEGHDLKFAMSLTQSLIIVGPALAPFLGSALLIAFDWRGIFACLAVFGAVCTALACLTSETHQERYRTSGTVPSSLVSTLSQAKSLISDRHFAAFALVMGCAAVPYFAWIATVSYDLLDFFALDYFGYSMCYALTCLTTIAAPYVYMALSKRLSVQQIVLFCLSMFVLTFVLLAGSGTASAVVFTLVFLPFALCEGIVRPMSYVVLLRQPPQRVGAASMLANFSYNIMTSIATVLATLGWPNFIFGLTVICAFSSALIGIFYLWGIRGVDYSYVEQ